MILKQQILKENSKSNTVKIADYIADDPDKFEELISLFLGNDYRVTQRASAVVSLCTSNHPQLITPHLKKVILNLKKDVNTAVKRNTVRLLQDIDIPNKLLGEAADICFKFLESKQEPIAVKAFSMTVLANICKKEPDLKRELQILIEDQLPTGSAGFKNRGNKVLKQIENY
ncbi:hypothetical protein LVD15_13190 [Fulvivirga maritima]|uniref:hypothetical protein n=1 Tax=Fulvivirga maritima TaxID=2904247 RepID=UPI001F1CEEE3|nr:hypothetical protein [Fulvivirga maritima]UII29340.1 hypothetical protein LVD15_13190 [Fulvivirga maritima]